MLTLGRPLAPEPDRFEQLFREVCERARWSNDGPLVRRLEHETARMLGWSASVAVSSGTTALTTALLSLGLPEGAEVITTPLTFRATALAIEAARLRPVFAGVDPETLLLDAGAAERAIGPRTGAILPVHLFGLAVDPALDDLAGASGLPVVYDAAHAFELENGISGRGAATAYSLHATKLLHTGEGGLIGTDRTEIADRARRIRNFGLEDGTGAGPGMNAKLPELSAAIGLSMMGRLDAEIAQRKRVREGYAEAMRTSTRVRPHAPGHERSVVLEAIRCDPRHQLEIMSELAAVDVLARSFPALCAPGERYATAPISGAAPSEMDALARSVIALPIHGSVTEHDIERIADVLGR